MYITLVLYILYIPTSIIQRSEWFKIISNGGGGGGDGDVEGILESRKHILLMPHT